MLDEGHCLRGQVLQICQLNGAEEQQDVRETRLETLRQMVITGAEVIFMLKIAIHGVELHSFCKFFAKRTIGFVWRKTNVRNILMEKLIKLLTDTVKGTSIKKLNFYD